MWQVAFDYYKYRGLNVMLIPPFSYSFDGAVFNHYYTKVRSSTSHMSAWSHSHSHSRLCCRCFCYCCEGPPHSLFCACTPQQSKEEYDLKNERGSPVRPRSAGRKYTGTRWFRAWFHRCLEASLY